MSGPVEKLGRADSNRAVEDLLSDLRDRLLRDLRCTPHVEYRIVGQPARKGRTALRVVGGPSRRYVAGPEELESSESD